MGTSRRRSLAPAVLLRTTTLQNLTNSAGSLTHFISRARAKEWPCNGPMSQPSLAPQPQEALMTTMTCMLDRTRRNSGSLLISFFVAAFSCQADQFIDRCATQIINRFRNLLQMQ